jgi:hypothetical protein
MIAAVGLEDAMTTVELIRAVGPALWGDHWQSPLSYALPVAARSVRRWAAGSAEPHPDNWARLAELMRERLAELQRLLPEVERRAVAER